MAGVMDVAGASPRRFFFEVLRCFTRDRAQAERLAYFASPAGREDLSKYNEREGAYPPSSQHQNPFNCLFWRYQTCDATAEPDPMRLHQGLCCTRACGCMRSRWVESLPGP